MIIFVYGTRPEAIKIAPVLESLRDIGVHPRVICTGQHTDLLDGVPDVFDRVEHLCVQSQGNVKDFLKLAIPKLRVRFYKASRALRRGEEILVVIQGDTMSALAGAKAADDLDIEVCHIEAGVRTFQTEPWPEESIRQQIGGMASWHICATEAAKANLFDGRNPYDPKKIDQEKVFVTGNPGISSLYRYTNARPTDAVGHTIVITLHRRELRIKGLVPGVLNAIYDFARLCPGYTFLWPVHPAMHEYVKLGKGRYPNNVVFTNPLPYKDMLELVATAKGLLTDSGGLVEEATTLGVPTAILRHSNDRTEAVDVGIAKRFDPERTLKALTWLVTDDGIDHRIPSNTYGDASSASTIASILASIDTMWT